LALEIAAPLRPTNGVVGNSPADPRDEHPNRCGERRESMESFSKLGIEIGQTSVTKYMARRRGSPSQGWKTFLRNHADGIVAMDLFVVPTISFRLLYGLLIMGQGRRQILWFGVTAHPTDEWIANQLTEACGWEQIPRT